MSNLVSYLLQTDAIKIAPENKPFWYTSGKIGPYFINTHFIYGSEEEANDLLNYIEKEKDNQETLPKKILEKTLEHYNESDLYSDVIAQMKDYITETFDLTEIDYISGGERRDWFFSNLLAYLLDKPHISIFKDMSTVITSPDFGQVETQTDLTNKKILHIADLITVASSYLRAWVPAIENLGGKITSTVAVVDRMQGGKEVLKEHGIDAYAMTEITPNLFTQILEMGYINTSQQELLNQFFSDPDGSMREFLIAHPEFLEQALRSDEKTKQRAEFCLNENVYDLPK